MKKGMVMLVQNHTRQVAEYIFHFYFKPGKYIRTKTGIRKYLIRRNFLPSSMRDAFYRVDL
jgi:hypothetical protein